jgi:hypothetical protein
MTALQDFGGVLSPMGRLRQKKARMVTTTRAWDPR